MTPDRRNPLAGLALVLIVCVPWWVGMTSLVSWGRWIVIAIVGWLE